MRVDVAFLRARHFLVAHARVVCALLLVVAVASAVGAVASYDGLPMETVEETKHPTTVGMSVGTHSVVTGNTSLYDEGTELNDAPVYLTSASPELVLTLRSEVPEGSRVEQGLSVTHRVSHSDGGEVFWEENYPVSSGRETVDSVSPAGVVTSGLVDVREVLERRTEIENEVGGAGKVKTFVVANVTYDTGRYEGKLVGETELVVDRRSYTLGGNVSRTEKHTTSAERKRVDDERVVTLPASVGGLGPRAPKRTVAIAGLGLSSLFVSLLVLVYGWVGPGRDRLRRRLDEERYSEWISVGELPSVTRTGDNKIRVRSLEDLVDVGIDTSKRTIHDPETERYGVIDDGTVYYYEGGVGEEEGEQGEKVDAKMGEGNGEDREENEFFFTRSDEYR